MPHDIEAETTFSSHPDEENISQSILIHSMQVFLQQRLKKLNAEITQLSAIRLNPNSTELSNEIIHKITILNQSILACTFTLNTLITPFGVCSGLTKLWLYAKWLSSQPVHPDRSHLKRDDATWFFNMTSILSTLDESKTDSLNEEQINELEHFIEQVALFQNNDSKLLSVNQNRLEQYILDSNGRTAQEEFAIGGLFTEADLATLLSIITLYPNKLIYIKSHNHAIGLFKDENNTFCLYNPNRKKKPLLIKNFKMLANEIFKAFKFEKEKPSPIGIGIFDMENEIKNYSKIHTILKEHNIQNNQSISPSYANGLHSLHIATLANSIDSVAFFLSHGHDPDSVTANHNTSLMLAVKSHFLEIAQYLLKEKVDINKKKPNGKTALILAIEQKNAAMVKLLLSHPEIDVNQADGEGDTPLIYAIRNQDNIILELLLKHKGIDINKRKKNDLPIFFAIANKNVNIVNSLLNCKEIHLDDTLLIFAILSQKHQVIKSFLDHRLVDIHAVDSQGVSPFLNALRMKNWDIIELMLFHPKFDMKKEPRNSYFEFFDLLKSDNVIRKKYQEKLTASFTRSGFAENQIETKNLSPKLGKRDATSQENLENQTSKKVKNEANYSDFTIVPSSKVDKKNVNFLSDFFKCNEKLTYSLTISAPRIRFSIR